MSCPRMCFRATKNQKFGHVFYSVFVRLPFTLSMVKECMDPVTCMLLVMLPILLEPACPVFVLRFVLLFSLSSGPGYLLHFSPTGTHSPIGHLASLSSGIPAVFISGALAPIFEFLPLSSQLISKTGYLLSFTLVGTPYPVGAWLPSPPGRLLPFSLTDGSSPVEALPLSLFQGTCYPSLSLALSIPLAPDLSLPLDPCIWGLQVLRCRLASTLAIFCCPLFFLAVRSYIIYG